MSRRRWTFDCRVTINQRSAKEPKLNIVTGLITRQNLLPSSLVLLRIVSFLPSVWINASPLPLARVLQTSSQEQRFEHRISAPGDTTFLHSHETSHLERLNQKLVILTQKVPQDDESSFILLQTSWHHKLTEFLGSLWRCLHGYRQNLKNSEVWPKGFKNQKTKNI